MKTRKTILFNALSQNNYRLFRLAKLLQLAASVRPPVISSSVKIRMLEDWLDVYTEQSAAELVLTMIPGYSPETEAYHHHNLWYKMAKKLQSRKYKKKV